MMLVIYFANVDKVDAMKDNKWRLPEELIPALDGARNALTRERSFRCDPSPPSY